MQLSIQPNDLGEHVVLAIDERFGPEPVPIGHIKQNEGPFKRYVSMDHPHLGVHIDERKLAERIAAIFVSKLEE